MAGQWEDALHRLKRGNTSPVTGKESKGQKKKTQASAILALERSQRLFSVH